MVRLLDTSLNLFAVIFDNEGTMNAKFKPRRIVVGREECVYFPFLHVQRRDHVNAYVYKASRIIHKSRYNTSCKSIAL